MKMHTSPSSNVLFKAIFLWVLLALFLPCSPVLAKNTHTVTVNETGDGKVTFSGSQVGTDNLTVAITPFISSFCHH